MLPYLEQQDLYDEYDFSQPWNSPKNAKLANRMPKVFRFHGASSDSESTTNYLAVVGEKTFWPGATSRTPEQLASNAKEKIAVVENHGQNIHWMEPRDLMFSDMSFEINSPNGISSKYENPAALMQDFSLRKLESDLSTEDLQAMLDVTKNSGKSGKSGWKPLRDGRDRKENEPPN